MKKLFEALKKINNSISDETLNSIKDIFEAAVEAKATEKSEALIDVVDDYINTIAESIKTETVSDIQEAIKEEIGEHKKVIDEELREDFDKDIKSLTEAIEMYSEHAAETYIEENKQEIVDAHTIAEAQKVLEVIGESYAKLGVDVISIQEGLSTKGSDSKELDDAVKMKAEYKDKLQIAENKVILVEKLSGKDVVVATKIEKLLEADLNLATDKFTEKLDTMTDVVESGSNKKPAVKPVDESKTKTPSWARK